MKVPDEGIPDHQRGHYHEVMEKMCRTHSPPLLYFEGLPQKTPFITTRDGTRFYKFSAPFRQITEVPEYWMEDIRADDHVLDIGANIGAFCIRAAKKSGHIFAVEPLATDILITNIALNRVNVQVFYGALGNGSPSHIEWDGIHSVVHSYRLRDLIQMAGGCDFLKCDCEGAEWQIQPAHLKGIRRIEMELHQPPIGRPVNPELLTYISRNYTFSIDRVPAHGPLGLFGILHAWQPSSD
jgi:hypothetical protein